MTEQPKFRWRIYYEDGSTFSNTDGAPHESPPWGVVVIAQRHTKPKQDEVLYGANADYFLYRKDMKCWHQAGEIESEGAVSVGLIDQLAHFGHLIMCVRPARWTADNANFKALYARAVEDVGV